MKMLGSLALVGAVNSQRATQMPMSDMQNTQTPAQGEMPISQESYTAQVWQQFDMKHKRGRCNIATRARDFLASPSMMKNKVFDDDSVVDLHTLLPIGGTYTGIDEIAEMISLEKQASTVEAYAASIHRVDLNRVLASVTFGASFPRTQRSVSEVKAKVVMEWNAATCKISKMVISAAGEDEDVLQEAYFTRGEKLYAHALKKYAARSHIDLQLSDPIFELFADNVRVDLTTSPTDFFPIASAQGKCELVAMLQANWVKLTHTLGDHVKEEIVSILQSGDIDSDVLFADDSEIIMFQSAGDIDMILHVEFNTQGLISYIHRTVLNPLFPPLLKNMPKIQVNKEQMMSLYFQALDEKSDKTCSADLPIQEQTGLGIMKQQQQVVMPTQGIETASPIVGGGRTLKKPQQQQSQRDF